MATIKSYSDLEQSRKLAEILPLESADMHYEDCENGFKIHCEPSPFGYEYNIPCWSLAALFGVLPDGTNVIKDKSDTENEKYMCTVGIKDDITSTFSDNPVDACVAMIEKLNELKVL